MLTENCKLTKNKQEPIKIFIAYSHKDEEDLKFLSNHLATLKRNGIIEEWSDKKITAGKEWENKIDENLKSSNIIIFLISSDFIASDYCVDIEAKEALLMHKTKKATVIPIIIRHCDWKSLFGEIQALPEKSKPISSWSDKDEAWLNVVNGIKKSIKSITETSITSSHQDSTGSKTLTPEFVDWLNNNEMQLNHHHVNLVQLDDVFVYPDLNILDSDFDKIASTLDSSDLDLKSKWNLIFGDEQSGKTSLAKQYFLKLLQQNSSPVLLNGSDIKVSNIEKILKLPLKKQYSNCDIDKYLSFDNKSIIIDDYANSTLNRKFQNVLLDNLKKTFECIILFGSDSFQYVVPDISSLDGFNHYEILRFGNLKRTELIRKWVILGIEEEIGEKELYDSLDNLKQHIDSFVKKNVVPSKPIFLLTILQSLETITPLGLELTSYGHCYQYLIYQALFKAKIKKTELETYINVLTELAGEILYSNSTELDKDNLEQFFNRYKKKYLKVDQVKMLNIYHKIGILQTKGERISFKYRYVYYFYAAKYLADNLSKNDSIKERIRLLISHIHKEDSANIIIFITHHTKDSWILDEIQLCMMELFHEHKEASLENKDLEFMKDFLDEIPKLVLEQRDIEEERKKDDILKDQAERIENNIDKKSDLLEPSDIIAKVNRTFKGTELIGQIIRNRYGSLDRETLLQLVEQAYSVGLRFLQFFLELTDFAKVEIIKSIAHMLKENPNVDNSQLEREAKNQFLLMTYGVIFGVLRKIAFSIGAKETEEIYSELRINTNTPAIKLINQAIELQFMKKVSEESIKFLSNEFRSNPVCERILKEIVIQHIYMHHIGYKEKQKLSEILELPITIQRKLEMKKSLEQ